MNHTESAEFGGFIENNDDNFFENSSQSVDPETEGNLKLDFFLFVKFSLLILFFEWNIQQVFIEMTRWFDFYMYLCRFIIRIQLTGYRLIYLIEKPIVKGILSMPFYL